MRAVPFVFMLISFPTSFAYADLIFDFEDKQGLSGLVSLTYSKPELTLTITRSSGTTFDIDNTGVQPFFNSLSPFNGTGGASVADVFQIELSRPVAAIFVDAGDFGEDQDSLFLDAFLGSGLTGQSSSTESGLRGGGSNFGYTTMQLVRSPLQPGFQSFRLRGGNLGSNVYWDNFAFRLTAVPEPESAILVFLALSLLGLVRKRSRPKPSLQLNLGTSPF